LRIRHSFDIGDFVVRHSTLDITAARITPHSIEEKRVMAEITAAAVKALREKTDLPMMECKKALMESGGDEAKAIEILQSQFEKVQLKRADNVTNEGRIFVAVKPDGSEAAAVEVQCESAPVAGGADLVKFGEALAKQLLEGPGAATPQELLAQSPAGGSQTFQQTYESMVNKIREKIEVTRIARVAGPVGVYVHHDGKTAVLFEAEGEKKSAPVLRDVAMHIAAMKPTVTNIEDVDPAAVKAERDRLSAEARATGKPDNIIDKIVDGRMGVFYRDDAGVLTEQPFAKDDKKTVSQALAEAGLKARNFTLWVIGG
jgi:elongation factor Ts